MGFQQLVQFIVHFPYIYSVVHLHSTVDYMQNISFVTSRAGWSSAGIVQGSWRRALPVGSVSCRSPTLFDGKIYSTRASKVSVIHCRSSAFNFSVYQNNNVKEPPIFNRRNINVVIIPAKPIRNSFARTNIASCIFYSNT